VNDFHIFLQECKFQDILQLNILHVYRYRNVCQLHTCNSFLNSCTYNNIYVYLYTYIYIHINVDVSVVYEYMCMNMITNIDRLNASKDITNIHK
jgi:hypothetical protein